MGLKIDISGSEEIPKLKVEVEEALEDFNVFFQSLGNSGMSAFEEAILRTFIVAHATGRVPSRQAASETSDLGVSGLLGA